MSNTPLQAETPPLVRECDDCALCCKLLSVASLGKPAGVWCTHCTSHRDCAIYESRPQVCRDFVCAYLLMPKLDERWKPSVCHFVLSVESDTEMNVVVDSNRPDAWRKEPFYGRFKQWARAGAGGGARILVLIGRRVLVIFPDGDVDLGVLNEDERVVTVFDETPVGNRLEVLKLHKDDPRAPPGAPPPFGNHA
jgi:Fe-S-cluster containining protein